MRVLHVATLVSPDGAYGGPVRVALNQLSSLQERGHDVTLAAAHHGFSQVPHEQDGVPLRLFPARRLIPGAGFAGLSSPGLTRWLLRNIDDFDVVHIHLARDLITLPAAAVALRRSVPLVVQTHGMIDPSARALAKPLDRLLTVPVLRAARRVLHLTADEAVGLERVAGDRLRLQELGNGIRIPGPRASGDGARLLVLFLARLHARKRPTLFVTSAKRLLERFPDVDFQLVGPDEGQGSQVRELLTGVDPGRLRWAGAVAPGDALATTARASIYVLPSVDEPYPMSVIEAMSLGVPVVITDSCGLADLVRRTGSGIVVEGDSVDALTAAMTTLLDDPDLRKAMGRCARETAERDLTIEAVTDVLAELYERVTVTV